MSTAVARTLRVWLTHPYTGTVLDAAPWALTTAGLSLLLAAAGWWTS